VLKFLCLNYILSISIILLGQDSSSVFITPEIPAQYKIGSQQLLNDIYKNLKSPSTQADITGRVYVSFTVDTTGKITNPKIKRGINELFDKEALRIISLLGEWTPGKLYGKKINTKMIIPITFNCNRSPSQ
jgi:protein TonB